MLSGLKSDIDTLENCQRRDNLIFYNVLVMKTPETWDHCKTSIINLCTKINLGHFNRPRSQIRYELGFVIGTNCDQNTDDKNALLTRLKEQRSKRVNQMFQPVEQY